MGKSGPRMPRWLLAATHHWQGGPRCDPTATDGSNDRRVFCGVSFFKTATCRSRTFFLKSLLRKHWQRRMSFGLIESTHRL